MTTGGSGTVIEILEGVVDGVAGAGLFGLARDPECRLWRTAPGYAPCTTNSLSAESRLSWAAELNVADATQLCPRTAADAQEGHGQDVDRSLPCEPRADVWIRTCAELRGLE